MIPTGLNQPGYVAGNPNNNIYLTDSVNNRIVEFVPLTNGVFTLAGSGTAQPGLSNSVFGDQALFSQPMGMVYDSFRGGLVVVDQANQVLRLVTLTNGVPSPPWPASRPRWPTRTAATPMAPRPRPIQLSRAASPPTALGNLYVADTGNDVIRRVNSTNGVTTVKVTNYTFYQPNAVALDTNNNLWVADTRNDTICVISNISVIVNQSAYIIAGTLARPAPTMPPMRPAPCSTSRPACSGTPMARACSSATPATTPSAASIQTPRKADFPFRPWPAFRARRETWMA